MVLGERKRTSTTSSRIPTASVEGDLFPRGRGEGDLPRVRKRDGTVIFASEKGNHFSEHSVDARKAKRERKEISLPSNDLTRGSASALGLSSKRLAVGMTLLGIVTGVSNKTVEIALPSGIKANADPDETLVDPAPDPKNVFRPRATQLPISSTRNSHIPEDSSSSSSSEEQSDDDTENDEPFIPEHGQVARGSDVAFRDISEEHDAQSPSDDEEDDESIAAGPRPLHKVVSVGDVVRVAVVSSEKGQTGKWKITVTCRPSLINVNVGVVGHAVSGGNSVALLRVGELMWAAIKAVEDHGYVVDFGSSVPTIGFLPYTELEEGTPGTLVPGFPVEVVILENARGDGETRKVVRVSSIKQKVNTAVSQYIPDMTYAALRAGMRVRARVSKIEDVGAVELQLFGIFPVIVDRRHVPSSSPLTVGSTVDARLLYVDAGAKRIGATLLDCIVNYRKPRPMPDHLKIGSIIAPVIVVQVNPRFGIVLQPATAANGDDSCSAHLFAHISRVSDGRLDKIDEKLRTGYVIDSGARIVSFSALDGVINVDLRPSVLSRKAIALHEVIPGEVYACKILSHSIAGALNVAVDGDVGIKGVVPSAHVSDSHISLRRLKNHTRMKIGAVVQCVCLTVDEVRERAVLSAKRSLVNSDRPLLSSYDQAYLSWRASESDQGTNEKYENIFDGTVAAITESLGILVVFAGNVRGVVPQSELHLHDSHPGNYLEADGADNETSGLSTSRDRRETASEGHVSRSMLEGLFLVGQTVRVRILHVDVESQRMKLSFNLSKSSNSSKSSERRPRPGLNLVCELTSVDEDSRNFILRGVPANVDQARSATGAPQHSNTIECVLPFEHLSDFPGLSKRIAAEYMKRLDTKQPPVPALNVIVLDSRGKRPLVTAKSSLLSAHAEGLLLSSWNDVLRVFHSDSENSAQQQHNNLSSDVSKRSKTVLRGFVRAVVETGVLVGFLGDTVGFIRKSRLSDDFIADPSKVISTHRSVSVVIESVDMVQKRFFASMRSSDCMASAVHGETTRYFAELETLRDRLQLSDVEHDFPIGTVVTSDPDPSHSDGLVCKITSKLGSAATAAALEPRSGESNTTSRRARVLDVDPFTGIVDISFGKDLVEKTGKSSALVNAEKRVVCTILLVKDDYLILSMPSGHSKCLIAFCLVPTIFSHFRHSVHRGRSLACVVLGQKYRRHLVAFEWSASSNGLGPCKRLREAPKSNLQSQRCSVSCESIAVGSKVSGKVGSVFPLNVSVFVAKGVIGRVHITNLDVPALAQNIENTPLGPFPAGTVRGPSLPKVGTFLQNMEVLSIKENVSTLTNFKETETSSEGFPLPTSSASPERRLTLELSLKSTPSPVIDFAALTTGSRLLGYVKGVKTASGGGVSGICIAFSPSLSGFCSAVDSITLSSVDVKDGRTVDTCRPSASVPKFQVGTAVACQVIAFDKRLNNRPHVAISKNGTDGYYEGRSGFYGLVLALSASEGIRVEIPWLARSVSDKERRWGLVSPCDICDDYDEAEKILKSIAVNDTVFVATVEPVKTFEGKHMILLSMRESVICKVNRDQTKLAVKDELHVGQMTSQMVGKSIRGFVRSVSKSGCFVNIGRCLVARVMLSDLSNDFVDNPEKQFPPGMLVSGKICAVEGEELNKVQLVFRSREKNILRDEQSAQAEALRDSLVEGKVLTCSVARIERYGAILRLSAQVSALLHLSEVDQDRSEIDPWAEWVVGQRLQVVVIKVGAGKKVMVGTKRCYFEAAGLTSEETDEVLVSNSLRHGLDADGSSAKDLVLSSSQRQSVKLIDECSSSSDVLGSEEIEEIANQDSVVLENLSTDADEVDQCQYVGTKDGVSSKDVLQVVDLDSEGMELEALPVPNELMYGDEIGLIGEQTDIDHSAREGNEGDEKLSKSDGEDSGDPIVDERKRRKSSLEKREKKRLKVEAEREIRVREDALASSEHVPETADDFERMLLGEPNASHVWIRYMAFRVSLSQLDKARALAERALETIDVTKELERVNIWLAYMNLEATYGVKDDDAERAASTVVVSRSAMTMGRAAVMRVFERACERVTDVEELHLKAARALRGSRCDLAEEILRRGLKLFKGSVRVWTAVGSFEFGSGQVAAGRQTLERALVSLDRRDHVEVIMKFAQLEYRYGSEERGRTVFESLVGNFPKRLDVWNVYLDMEMGRYRKQEKGRGEEMPAAALSVKEGSGSEVVESVRRIFERCVSLEFSTKKTKFLFKKWLTFEVETGDKAAQAKVVAKARHYVETKLVSVG